MKPVSRHTTEESSQRRDRPIQFHSWYDYCLAASTFAYPFVVVGEEEMNTQSVNVRNRYRDDVGSKVRAEMMPLDDIATKLLALKSSRSLHNKL